MCQIEPKFIVKLPHYKKSIIFCTQSLAKTSHPKQICPNFILKSLSKQLRPQLLEKRNLHKTIHRVAEAEHFYSYTLLHTSTDLVSWEHTATREESKKFRTGTVFGAPPCANLAKRQAIAKLASRKRRSSANFADPCRRPFFSTAKLSFCTQHSASTKADQVAIFAIRTIPTLFQVSHEKAKTEKTDNFISKFKHSEFVTRKRQSVQKIGKFWIINGKNLPSKLFAKKEKFSHIFHQLPGRVSNFFKL